MHCSYTDKLPLEMHPWPLAPCLVSKEHFLGEHEHVLQHCKQVALA